VTATAPPRPLRPSLRVGTPRPVIPGPGLPDDAVVDASNNNLDATWHEGTLYLAWRTAPTHFASPRARIQVLASDDGGRTWRLDYSVVAKRDLREPRLVSWRGELLLYWFTAGSRGRAFEPDRIWVTQRAGPAGWREPEAISPPDCVVWRVRPLGDRLAMSVYRGAGRLYTTDPVPLTVELWGSDDGWSWSPFDPAHPVVHHGGAEAEFLRLPDGRVLSVVRKEGPDGGWGSDVGISPVEDPTHWVCRPDPRKFDSPWLFLDDGRPVLITRRTTALGGRYDAVGALEDHLDVEVPLDPHVRTKLDQGLYWLTPKRTSVYLVDPDTLEVDGVGDLPSAGDTAFAATVPTDDGAHLCFNYSSPPRHGSWPWVVGQLRPTSISVVELRFHP
jgi:hypothetical protein